METNLELYRMLRLIRRVEERLMEEYHPADEMRCPMHFCIGQEASPAALSPLLREDDVLMTHHRSHGYYLAKGAPLDAMVAEFYGKATGANGGLAGSHSLSHAESRFHSGTVLSGTFAIAAGDAFATRYEGTDRVTVAVIGDGGMEEGIVYETLNLASLLSLPVLFICENNLYSVHSHIDARSVSRTVIERAGAFGVETHLLDGNDPLTLHENYGDFIAKIRAGGGPVFAEIQTYRYCGHVGPEDDDHLGYRTPEEVRAWQKKDPVRNFRDALFASTSDEAVLADIDANIESRIEASIAAAKAAPYPSCEEAYAYNLTDTYDPIVEVLPEAPLQDFEAGQVETMLKPY